MDISVGDSINYTQSVARVSKYKHTKLTPITGGDTVTAGATSVITSFEIPVQTYNLAESYLTFTAPASADVGYYRNVLPIERLELYSRGGVYLCDITNAAHWSFSTISHNKKISDYISSVNDLLVPTAANNIAPLRLSVANTAVRFQISGKELADTIFSLDKSIFCAEVLNLRITWKPRAEWGYRTGNVAINADVALTNVAFYLATEMNESVDQDLKAQVYGQGMQLMFPMSHMFKNNFNSATNAISIRLGRGQGMNLERLYTSSFPTAVPANVQGRYNPLLPSSLYSLIDSKRMQEFDVIFDNQDDVMLQKRMVHDKVYGLNGVRANFLTWEESYCDSNRSCAESQVAAGLNLDNEVKYDLYVNFGGAVQRDFYTTAVCQRQLLLTPQGVRVV
jgi:hypothetical protein